MAHGDGRAHGLALRMMSSANVDANVSTRLDVGVGGTLRAGSMTWTVGIDGGGVFCGLRNFPRIHDDDFPWWHVCTLNRFRLGLNVSGNCRDRDVQLVDCGDAHELEDDGGDSWSRSSAEILKGRTEIHIHFLLRMSTCVSSLRIFRLVLVNAPGGNWTAAEMGGASRVGPFG